MLKRLAPILTTLLSVLLDTAVIPVIYAGRFQIPLSLIVVILIGIQLGRVSGLLYGTIAGLLLDISAGSLGMKFFPYIAIGFLIGFLLDQQPEIHRSMERIERFHLVAVRLIWVVVLVTLHEIVMLIIQYFNTAELRPAYFVNIGVRSLICAALTLLLRPVAYAILVGEKRRVPTRHREVKSF